MYFLLPHWVPATWRSRAQTSMVEEKEFTDLQYYGDPYKTDQENFPAIFALQRTGIIDGYPDGSFGPNDGITRAQAAKILDLFTDIPGLEVRRYDQ